jgi:hypothetical protein
MSLMGSQHPSSYPYYWLSRPPEILFGPLIWFSVVRHCRTLLINLGLDVTSHAPFVKAMPLVDVWSRSNNCSLCFTFTSAQTLSLLGCRIVKIGCDSMRSSLCDSRMCLKLTLRRTVYSGVVFLLGSLNPLLHIQSNLSIVMSTPVNVNSSGGMSTPSLILRSSL